MEKCAYVSRITSLSGFAQHHHHFKIERTVSQETHQYQTNCDRWSPYTFIRSQARGQREQPRYFYGHFFVLFQSQMSLFHFTDEETEAQRR